MPLFLTTLAAGGPDYWVEQAEQGFLIRAVAGHEEAFGQLARQVMDRSGETFTALPRTDGRGDYDSVQILVHDA